MKRWWLWLLAQYRDWAERNETPRCGCGDIEWDEFCAIKAGWVFKRARFAGPRTWQCESCWRGRS